MTDRLTEIDTALAAMASMERLARSLERLRGDLLQRSLSDLPRCDVLPTEHRRQHRPGVQGTIDANPELQAFNTARLDHLTFKQIADHFPPALHIHQATVHRWWHKRAATTRLD